MNAEERQKALRVKCPACGALPGQECKRLGEVVPGRLPKPHATRLKAAQR